MLKIYNTLSRQKEVFLPRKGRETKMFACGPTVYDSSHLGHGRTFLFYDMLVKYLRQKGFKVFYLQNITDIDNKIIQRAKEKKTSWRNIARFFEKEYLRDMKALGIKSVSKYARATSHIKEIKSQVERLLEKGFAYQIEDGIYFDVKKFADYGKLSGRTTESAEDGVSRIDESVAKKNKADFCLWKFSKQGEPKWQSPWGWGRPGWHIEDTAIAEKFFGFQYDIHGGAIELVFPHHEAEISQMEAISGKKPMVKYWIHSGILLVEGRKMAKSLKNFITLNDFLKKFSPCVLRLIVFSSHYRSPLDYSENVAREAKANVEKIEEFLRNLKSIKEKTGQISNKKLIADFEKEFFSVLEDDFNTTAAKGIIFDFLAKINEKITKNDLSRQQAKEIIRIFLKINNIFGIFDAKKALKSKKEKIPESVKKLVEKREKLRKEKEWGKADEIRKEIEKAGYLVEDTAFGPSIKKENPCK